MAEKNVSYKRRLSNIKKYRIHALLTVVLGIVVLTAFWPAYVWSGQLDREINGLEQEKKLLAQKGTGLQEEIRRLNTSEYVEQLARKDLGLVRPGEVPITQVIPSKP